MIIPAVRRFDSYRVMGFVKPAIYDIRDFLMYSALIAHSIRADYLCNYCID